MSDCEKQGCNMQVREQGERGVGWGKMASR